MLITRVRFVLASGIAVLLAGTVIVNGVEHDTAHVESSCPEGKCCLVRVGLRTHGEIKYEMHDSYECKIGMGASRGSGFMKLDPLKHTDRTCDESPVFIPEGAHLNAAIHPIRRDDDLNYLCGTFTITVGERPLFEGEIELIHRLNTHTDPFGAGPCDPADQLQGWLTGKGAADGPTQGLQLRTMIVAKTEPIEGGKSGYRIQLAHLNGVILECRQ